MARPKAEPAPVLPKAPPAARAIVVSQSSNAFAAAVYDLGLEPDDAWRALNPDDALAMQADWRERGIDSYLVQLPEPLRGGDDDDEATSQHAEEQAEAA